MSLSPQMSVVLTLLFGVTGAGHAVLAVLPSRYGVARAGDVLHLLMSVSMVSMPWSWGMQVAPPGLQTVVFALAAGFYAVLLAAGRRGPGHGRRGGRMMLGYHVVMMAAMVVMALLMQGAGGPATASMPGMDMGSDMAGLRMGPALRVLSWLLVVVFGAGAVWMAGRLLGAGRPVRARAEDGLLVLMSAGMALAFVPA